MAIEETLSTMESKWQAKLRHSGWRWIVSIATALVATLKPELLRICGLFVAVALATRAYYKDFGNGSIRRTVVACMMFSVLSVALYFGVSYLEGLFHEPERVTITAQDASAIKDSLTAQTLESAKNERYSNESLPGLSVQMLIRLTDFQPGRRNYIFDFGFPTVNRLGAYVGPGNFLTLALVDGNGEPHSLVVPLGADRVPQKTVFYLTAECGTGNKHTVLRLRVNTKEVGLLDLPFETKIGALWHAGNVIGSNLDKKSGGYFDAYEMAAYSRTVTFKEASSILLVLQERLTQPAFLRFSGNQWAVRNANDNNMTLSNPIWVKP